MCFTTPKKQKIVTQILASKKWYLNQMKAFKNRNQKMVNKPVSTLWKANRWSLNQKAVPPPEKARWGFSIEKRSHPLKKQNGVSQSKFGNLP